MTAVREITTMLEMLPQQEQDFACEVVRKLIIAWDSDFTKLTAHEAVELKLAHIQAAKGEVFADNDIDWNNLDNLNLG